MTGWLDPLRTVLAEREEPVRFFFRDDDAGWHDEALEELLDVFELHEVPVDVAAIPVAMTARTATLIAARQSSGRNDITVHQHGFAHVNHEPEGRKCEFGASRSPEQQRDDIARGRDELSALLGDLPAVFTPPWNRCAPWTAQVLHDLGFAVLSRDLSAGRPRPFGAARCRTTRPCRSSGSRCSRRVLACSPVAAPSAARVVGSG